MFPLKILIIEEYPFERAVIVKILNHLGYSSVNHASSASEGLAALLKDGAVDLVICNLQFNRMSEVDTLTLLRVASEQHLIHSVVISEKLPSELQHFIKQVISTMGIELLGDLDRPYDVKVIDSLLRCKSRKRASRAQEISQSQITPTKRELLEALARHEIRAHYQPKIDLITGKVVGAEVLARWESNGKIILPDEFLPAIEAFGLMDIMFYELLEQGLEILSFLQRDGYTLPLAFNLHCSQLMDLELTMKIHNSLSFHNIPASHLTFELTENGLIENSPIPLENLIRLRVMGCGLSIDDFGVGFSSLERLCQLPFSEIKIDAGFVQSMIVRTSCKAAIENTLALAVSLNMKVVAEGVETMEQRSALLQMGCTVGQGYLYAPPMKWSEMQCWVIVGSKRDTPHESNKKL